MVEELEPEDCDELPCELPLVFPLLELEDELLSLVPVVAFSDDPPSLEPEPDPVLVVEVCADVVTCVCGAGAGSLPRPLPAVTRCRISANSSTAAIEMAVTAINAFLRVRFSRALV